MCQGRLMAALGIFVALYNMVWCTTVIIYNVHVPLYASHAVALSDYIFMFFIAVSMFLSLVSFFRVCCVSPGVPPPWMAEGRVERFLRDFLGDLARRGARVAPAEAATESISREAAGTPVSLTSAAADKQQTNDEGELSAAQEGRNELAGDNDFTAIPMAEVRAGAEDAEAVKTSAGETSVRAQEVSNETETLAHDMAFAAADALEAMERSRESFEQEVSFLLGGARHCRFCRIYKLEDTQHCSACRTCVHGMDQHCPLFGQCVGSNNHKFMLLFVLYTTILGALLLLHSYIVVHRWGSTLFSASNSGIFVFSIFTAIAFVIALGIFCAQSFILLLRGDNMMRVIRMEERNYLAAQRREVRGGTFSILLEDDTLDAPSNAPSVSNLRRTFGTGSVFPWWFLPLLPQRPTAEAQEEAFYTEQRNRIEQQLRILVEGNSASNGEEVIVSPTQR